MKRFKTSLVVAMVLVLGTGLLIAQAGPPDKAAKKLELPLCPVMGNPINLSVSMMADDGPVYLCCPGCDKKINAEPKKFAKKIAEQRAVLAKLPRVQVACPVTGKPIDKKAFIEEDGKKVYFFCDKCPKTYKKDPSKYKGKLLASYTYQTTCPVMGNSIDPSVFTTLKNGQKVYFCCSGCIKKFHDTPEKYTDALKKQGYSVSAKIVGKAPATPKKKKG